MASKININAKKVAELNLIIERYEQIDPSSGTTVASKTWKIFDGVEMNMEVLKKTTDTKKLYDEFKKYLGDQIKTGNDALFDPNKEGTVTKEFNDFFQDVYSAGKSVNRETSIPLGDQNLKINGTIGAIANSKNFGELASVLLNDCLPCQPRADGIQFKPDLNFLDKLIGPLTQLIDTIQSLALTLTDTGPFKGQFCATLNALNFVCLPDLQAINLSLVKNLKMQLGSLPSLKLPGLSDLALFVVLPFLTALVNLVQQWINVVVKPLKCAIASIQKQISKLKIKTKGFDLGLTVNFTKNTGLELKSHELNSFVSSLDTTNHIQNLVAGLGKLSGYLTKIEKDIMAWLKRNILDKFTGAMNTMTASINSIVVWLKKITEAANFLLMFAALKNIFYTEFSQCKDKDSSFDNTKESVKENISKLLGTKPNISTSEDNGVIKLEKELTMTEEELSALGLKKAFPGLRVEKNIQLNSEEDTQENNKSVRIIIDDQLNIDNCKNINMKEVFFNTEGIINEL